MRFGIVGCGLIGTKRASALRGEHSLTAVADSARERAERLAQQSGATVYDDWRRVIDDGSVDAVIVATPHVHLAAIALAAIEAGKHVLVEKPGARHGDELLPLLDASRARGVHVQIGFNHRYHPAFARAREIYDSEAIGPLMFVRGRYGHGGRLGYDREWRADPALSGGGELLDQGVHLIDLARWFLGDLELIAGEARTYFWDMPVEDNGFLLLRSARGQVASLHASWTEWKNLFSFEIYGKTGKLHIEGLGGSYGVERLAYYRMLQEMGPPETTIWEYPGQDLSFDVELQAFVRGCQGERAGLPSLEDARASLDIVHQVYRSSNR